MQELKWTPDRVAALNDLRRAGVKDVKLAQLLGVSRQRVHVIGRMPEAARQPETARA